ncbi:2-polyprenyl-6-methoxyphenol hydroxylase [Mycobacterium sp. KBS0706]|uniref:FAD binding domain-containing protein n=1 Tax=Mycobacterium sp. KBS0706 TaxID=2578109 RepID=UPI00110FE63B|nr:FAD-dependent monooxygenase [Mycobacterium sp. KBS0706]TSD89313.1 2-polyprenyl-6-methoxyphenol hydroxylase [Mycobacterium sp. KBS0706]
MKPLRIRIVGGSLAGLFAGVLLQRDGHDVRIYERSTGGLSGRGAGLVAQREVFQILRLIGFERIARIGVVAKERIVLDRAGQVVQTVATPQTQISWDVLYDSVASRFTSDHYLPGRQAVDVVDSDAGAVISFSDGSTDQADLVIGADGIGSVVRRSVNPESPDNHFAGYVAWRGLVPESQLPEAASLLLDRFTFYLAPGAQVLGYLVPGPTGEMSKGDRRYNWVWYRRVRPDALAGLFTDRAGRTHAFSLPRGGLSDEGLHDLRRDAFESLPRQLALAVSVEDTPSIQGIFDYQAPQVVGRSVALIGDAAFVVRPHTAMGVSKAAGDVMALQRHLATRADLRSALAGFELERRAVGEQIAAYGRRLGATAL